MACVDRMVKCKWCGSEFVFRVEEQRGTGAGGEVSEPETCPACRQERGSGERVSGIVKWFDQTKGYGFIKRDDGRGEVFVHYSDIEYVGFKALYAGEKVEFGVTPGRRGEQAVRVTGHDAFGH